VTWQAGDHLELIALAGAPSGRELHPEPLLQQSLLRRQLVGVVLVQEGVRRAEVADQHERVAAFDELHQVLLGLAVTLGRL
jgi:hypothetical protein